MLEGEEGEEGHLVDPFYPLPCMDRAKEAALPGLQQPSLQPPLCARHLSQVVPNHLHFRTLARWPRALLLLLPLHLRLYLSVLHPSPPLLWLLQNPLLSFAPLQKAMGM